MYLQRIALTHYKSYEADSFQFCEGINCIVGDNGSGKTNLLDAIYFLSLTKSAFSNQDALAVNHDATFMMIDGMFYSPTEISEHKTEQITCSIQRGQKKVLMRDKKLYDRLSDHIGKFPVVLIAPNDTDIIRDGSEERRKFFDGILSQLHAAYLIDLLQYNRILDQRNSLLKQFAERNYLDEILLDAYSQPLLEYAQKLYRWRNTLMQTFVPVFQKHYKHISESREQVEVIYESEVGNDDFEAIFRQNRQRDMAAQRTTKGSHKDDYVFEIDGYTLRKFGSQGQQKSFLIALKLAQFELLSIEKQIKPILLLDDIFDKLDERRIEKLVTMMSDGTFGQVFVTDARPERTRQLLSNLTTPLHFFEISK
jgi:DNA replication and repair protein RecF